jgi:hypothetical protein
VFGDKMETRNKHVFWEALVIAIFIFGIGIFLGYLIEMNRTSNIISLYQQTELDLLDNRIQDNLASLESIDCNKLFDEVTNFANRIYDEAKLLDKYEGSNQFSESIVLQHKKYDLLRAELWVNSLKIKERCVSNFTTLVYFYEYNTKSLEIKSEQSTFSKKLSQVKQEKGDSVILIPIAGNLETSSINYLKRVYDITSYPVILVDEKVKIDSIDDLNSLDFLN